MKKALAIIIAIVATTLATEAQRLTRQGYVDRYKQWAVEEMNRVGIPASITLAQGILESDCGNSELATDGNNHFGIKCHSDWTGETILHDDDRNQECFRKYVSAYDSFKDHSDFIKQKSRYDKLFKLDITDYKGWANGLKAAGYATDPSYAQKIITIIEEMGLNTLDGGEQPSEVTPNNEIANNTETDNETKEELPVRNNTLKVKKDASFVINPLHEHDVEYNNGVKYIATINGDTFEGIAKEFHLMVSELLAYNDLDASANISEIKYIYIRSKKNRAHPDCKTHTVAQGETLWSIAHKYGVKLKKLKKFNHLTDESEIKAGDTLNLRR